MSGTQDYGIPLFVSASKLIKAPGAGETTAQGTLLGVLCCTSTATATLDLYDVATSVTTSGHIVQSMALPAATQAPAFIRIPVAFSNGLYAVIGGSGSVGLTFVYR